MSYKKKLPPQLANYEMVEDRLKRFWEKCPNGRIDTEVINVLFDGKGVMVKAHLYEHRDDKHPIATGIALDYVGKGSFADSNYTELAETSAIGRAIANSPHQSKKAKRPSREEMEIALGRRKNEKKEEQQPEVDKFYEEVKEEAEVEEKVETEVKTLSALSDDEKKQELFEHVKELASEWEKSMIEKNPDIDPEKDNRMKFYPTIYNNMEKCLDTLGWKKYETKWNQWKSIYKDFPLKKLEPRVEEDDISIKEAKGIIQDGGINLMEMNIAGEGDFPPVDEKFNQYPTINKSAPYKGREPLSPASSKQVETIQKCIKFRKLEETKAVRWANHIYGRAYQTLGDLTKEEASQMIGAFFSESKK
jgi:hypothetical protein